MQACAKLSAFPKHGLLLARAARRSSHGLRPEARSHVAYISKRKENMTMFIKSTHPLILGVAAFGLGTTAISRAADATLSKDSASMPV